MAHNNGRNIKIYTALYTDRSIHTMKEVIAIINQKGGVGKSTTASAIGAGLILKGYSVLLVDLDAQGNLTFTMGADNSGITSLDILSKTASAERAIQHTANGDIIPAGSQLYGADNLITAMGKEYRLRDALEPVKKRYDYIIIDTPPALGILAINALTACTGVIIPAQADIYSLQGISQLQNTIQTVKQHSNHSLQVFGIVLTRHSPRTILSRDLTDMISQTAKKFNTRLFGTAIRENIAIKEAQARQMNIFAYAPRSKAADDYRALTDELLKTMNGE